VTDFGHGARGPGRDDRIDLAWKSREPPAIWLPNCSTARRLLRQATSTSFGIVVYQILTRPAAPPFICIQTPAKTACQPCRGLASAVAATGGAVLSRVRTSLQRHPRRTAIADERGHRAQRRRSRPRFLTRRKDDRPDRNRLPGRRRGSLAGTGKVD